MSDIERPQVLLQGYCCRASQGGNTGERSVISGRCCGALLLPLLICSLQTTRLQSRSSPTALTAAWLFRKGDPLLPTLCVVVIRAKRSTMSKSTLLTREKVSCHHRVAHLSVVLSLVHAASRLLCVFSLVCVLHKIWTRLPF